MAIEAERRIGHRRPADVAEGTRRTGASGLFDALKRYGFRDRRSMPGLDGLRAISIGFVLVAHLTGARGFVSMPFLWQYELGRFGVRVFFVISGFLITSILLKELRQTGRIALGRFYFRRTMRLFPACYVLIAVTALLAVNGAVQLKPGDLAFAATYTMNYHVVKGWPLTHLWSLAIEEQFYLLWPAVLVMLGSARSRRVLVGVLAVAPVIRLTLLPVFGFVAVSFLTWSDALASGCLLALLRHDLVRNTLYAQLLSSRWFVLVPAAALTAAAVPFTKVSWLICETIMNLAIAMSVDWAIRNPDTAVGRVLNWPAISFIGVLSYSLYLWQQPFLNPYSGSWYCAFPMNIALTFAVALASYLIVEAPLLRLRVIVERRWEARKMARTDPPGTATEGQGVVRIDRGMDQEQVGPAPQAERRGPHVRNLAAHESTERRSTAR